MTELVRTFEPVCVWNGYFTDMGECELRSACRLRRALLREPEPLEDRLDLPKFGYPIRYCQLIEEPTQLNLPTNPLIQGAAGGFFEPSRGIA